MNRITKRTWLMSLFILVLVGGMVFFLGDYMLHADEWIVFQGSPHVYNGTNIGFGTVTDRTGEVLLNISGDRTYSENAATRKATMHWLGDRVGHISASAVSSHVAEMAGFDIVNGIYDPTGSGGAIRLTLSAKAQNAALEAMAGRRGTVAVYNYKTGEILCAVTTPTYDPDNAPEISEEDPGEYAGVYLNRFIQSSYVPGSIFKIVTTAAALDGVPGIAEETFMCYGELEYGTEAVTCESMHGRQTLKQAFANSCNCAFAQVAERIGKQKMVEYVKEFAVTERLRFDGVTTAAGMYDVSAAAPVSFAWSCIGQFNDLINPARYMTFMGTIANGGVGVEPHIVSRVESGDSTTYKARPEKTGRVMSKEVAAQVGEYMRNNVTTVYGDGNFPGLKVCAKSGTSELGGDLAPNAMFSGFVQNEEYPLAFVVVVENGGYGSSTCVPVLRPVLAACKAVLDGE